MCQQKHIQIQIRVAMTFFNSKIQYQLLVVSNSIGYDRYCRTRRAYHLDSPSFKIIRFHEAKKSKCAIDFAVLPSLCSITAKLLITANGNNTSPWTFLCSWYESSYSCLAFTKSLEGELLLLAQSWWANAKLKRTMADITVQSVRVSGIGMPWP